MELLVVVLVSTFVHLDASNELKSSSQTRDQPGGWATAVIVHKPGNSIAHPERQNAPARTRENRRNRVRRVMVRLLVRALDSRYLETMSMSNALEPGDTVTVSPDSSEFAKRRGVIFFAPGMEYSSFAGMISTARRVTT